MLRGKQSNKTKKLSITMSKKIVDQYLLRSYGRPLSGSTYKELRDQILPGENLVGVFDRMVYSEAPLITSEHEFDRYYKDYTSGLVMFVLFYAVKNEDIYKYAS